MQADQTQPGPGGGGSGQPLPSARAGLMALFLSGLLMGLLGAILPAWRYHIEADFLLIGAYFLSLNAGTVAGTAGGRRFVLSRGVRNGLVLGCGLAAAGLALLGVFSPPAHFAWRLVACFATGLGAGLIQTGALHAIVPAYEHEPASTLSLGGVLFNLGALTTVLVVAGAFFAYTIQAVLLVMAFVPAVASVLYARARMEASGKPGPGWRDSLRDFRSPAAILFSLLLFFQFGNEGALTGWLAIYLIQQLGMSPVSSLLLLALFWIALLVGRVASLALMRRFGPGRLLAGAVLVPMFGCLVLSATDNLFGAITAVLVIGGGFGIILPLVLDRIAGRFPYFHPGYFSGIFSLALTGALLAPASVAVFAHFFGIGAVAGLPLIGSVAVFLLYWLLVLESKLSHRPEQLM